VGVLDTVLARHDYAYDEQQTVGAALVFDGPVQDLLLSLIDANGMCRSSRR
jgi:hypothetical protein